MTTEEKAKAYDEAIERAKSKLHYPDKPCFVDVTEIFPELAEREDERIRKAIKLMYSFLPNKPKYIGDVSVEDMFAWLEKQGDKVSAIEGFETEFKRQVSHLIASAINREHEYNEGYVKWTANALLNFAKRQLEKQNEQNPAWSEDDKQWWKVITQMGLTEAAIDWIRTLIKRATLQPKQEWSEEDEEIYRKCICAMRASACGFPEEEKFVEQVDNWLKSLKDRYTWKPSDEQMHYLSWIANVKLGDSVVEQEVSKHLNELLEQLKKLKE